MQQDDALAAGCRSVAEQSFPCHALFAESGEVVKNESEESKLTSKLSNLTTSLLVVQVPTIDRLTACRCSSEGPGRECRIYTGLGFDCVMNRRIHEDDDDDDDDDDDNYIMILMTIIMLLMIIFAIF